MVTTIITAMAAYSNKRVAAIVLSVLYRMLTIGRYYQLMAGNSCYYQLLAAITRYCPGNGGQLLSICTYSDAYSHKMSS